MHTLNGNNIVHVKSHNRQAILLQLLHAPLSRVELAHTLGLSQMTVTNIVKELLADGWIIPTDKNTFHHSGRGRPRTRLAVNRSAIIAIGVHIGIGSYRVALVDLIGTPIAAKSATFDPKKDAVAVLTDVVNSIECLLAEHAPTQILGIGFGASGLVAVDTGINQYAPSLGWHDVPVAAILQEQTKLPVVVENNVRAMALAEAYFGQGREVGSLAFIFGRIGIGAGLVINGDIMRGTQAGAGEIGHTTILPEGGVLCRCGQHGCLETLVTQPAIIDIDDAPIDQFEQLLQLARAGDRIICAQLEQIAYYLSIALSNLINTINPERIILGGMYAQGADIFLPLLRERVANRAFGRLGEHIQIKPSTFGLDAGIIGAASIALINLFYKADTIHSRKFAQIRG